MPEMSTATHINRAEIAGRIEAMELLKKDLMEFALTSRYDDKKDIDLTEWSPESLMARLWKAVNKYIKDREIAGIAGAPYWLLRPVSLRALSDQKHDPEFWYDYLTVLFEGFPVELPLCAIADAKDGLVKKAKRAEVRRIVKSYQVRPFRF